MKYLIGDFSKITRLSIKTLRFYHEEGLLCPDFIDPDSGYRFYDESLIDRAKTIQELRSLEFPLKTIKEILEHSEDDAEILNYLREKSVQFTEQIHHYEILQHKLEAIITHEESAKPTRIDTQIIEKNVSAVKTASIRFVGEYTDIGTAISKLMRDCGRQICGAPFSLYYDGSYKEDDADIEVCVPVRQTIETEDVKTRDFSGGKALSILHMGPYETLGSTYKTIIDRVNSEDIEVLPPPREIYLKGPGMILPRSPKRFITEIQMMIEEKEPSG